MPRITAVLWDVKWEWGRKERMIESVCGCVAGVIDGLEEIWEMELYWMCSMEWPQ